MIKRILLLAFGLMSLTANAQEYVEPQYPGGEEALKAFIESNLQYPKSVTQDHYYGKIFVRVQVDEKGNTKKVSLPKKSGHSDMDKEALRVVKLIKKWKPSTYQGMPMNGERNVTVDFHLPDVTPVEGGYPGGREVMKQFFASKIQYPEKALKDRISGTVYVDVTIDKNGKGTNIHITDPSEYPDIDAEAVRVVKLVKNWVPKTVGGVPVESTIFVPVDFVLPKAENGDDDGQEGQEGEGGEGGEQQTTIVEIPLSKNASYPGGMVDMTIFVSKNTKYPAKELKENIEGDVYVQFIVDTDGTIKEPEVIKSVSPGLDAEALRIVRLMPKWEPAVDKEGNKVATMMAVPLNFRTPKAIDGVVYPKKK